MKLPCSRAATLLCITAAATLAACVDAPPDDDLGESEQWVEGGTLASAGKLARAAKLHPDKEFPRLSALPASLSRFRK